MSRLWRISRDRLARGTTGSTAHQLVSRLLEAVDKNLALARVAKKVAETVREELGQEPQVGTGLDAAADRLLAIRAEGDRLLAVIDAPTRWPDAEQLKEARAGMQCGDRLTAEEFRQAMLDDPSHPPRLSDASLDYNG